MPSSDIQEKTRQQIAGFVSSLNDRFAGSIKSVIVFGSAAGGDYLPDKSDINLLIVTAELPASLVVELKTFLAKTASFLKSPPLVLSLEDVTCSLDIFPLEFLSMKSHYQVLSGEDVLKAIEPSQQDLRLQCEREIKGKLINLRQAYLNKKLDLKHLIQTSFRSFLPVFLGLLHLRGQAAPSGKPALLTEVAESYGLDKGLWERLLAVSTGQSKPGRVELQKLFADHLNDVAKLAKIVDQL